MLAAQRRDHNKITLWHMVVIIIAGLVLTFPSILYGFPAGGHDSRAHLSWYVQFSSQLWKGEFYPRWLINENSGLGGPVFFYYGPVPYYISSILRPSFQNDLLGWHQLGLSAVFGLIASGFGTYLWIKNITNEKNAVIAAVIYMIMPYHLAINLYERAAFAEYWSFVWMPLILYFVSKIKTGQRFAAIGLAISYALLIMTHLPTTLIFSIIPLGYSFINVSSPFRRKAIWMTISAMTLGIALSAAYLLPAISTQNYVNIKREGIWTLYMDHFLFAKFFPTQLFHVELTLVVLGMIVLAACATIIYRLSSAGRVSEEIIFWIVVLIISVYMMTPFSKSIIQLFPVLHRIQFPWRYNSLLVVATVAIFAIGFSSLKSFYTTKLIALGAISALLITSWIMITFWQGIQESNADKTPINEIIKRGTYDFNYRPKWVQTDIREFAESTSEVAIVSGTGFVEVKEWAPRNIILRVNSPDIMELTVGQLYYPGWTGQILGRSCCVLVQPSESKGLINISIPSGNYDVAIRLMVSTQESIGQVISAISAFIILLLTVWLGIDRFGKVAVCP